MVFLGKKPQTLMIPIYSTTVLYDKNSEDANAFDFNYLTVDMWAIAKIANFKLRVTFLANCIEDSALQEMATKLQTYEYDKMYLKVAIS